MMHGFLGSCLPVPVGPGRSIAAIVILACGLAFASEDAKAQTVSCDALIADIAAQQKMIGIFGTLDYHIRQHFLFEANAILSSYGGWNTIEGWGTTAGKLRDSTTDFEQQASTIRREIGRSKVASAEELKLLNDAVDSYESLIETGVQIAAEIYAGRTDEANQIYYKTARPNYIQVHGTLYTLISTAQKRVASMTRMPCT